jgi:Co/Zn/Cd efflux system component
VDGGDARVGDRAGGESRERGAAHAPNLHVWRLGPGHSAVVATIVCPTGNTAAHFKQKLSDMRTLSRVTVEVLEPKQ